MDHRLADAMAALHAAATDHDLANLDRFGIVAPNALGVSMANLQTIAKRLGRDRARTRIMRLAGVGRGDGRE